MSLYCFRVTSMLNASSCLLFQGYKYAAMQARVYCFCGSEDYSKYGKSVGCSMPCPGNPEQKCGGSWANQVFEIGKIR